MQQRPPGELIGESIESAVEFTPDAADFALDLRDRPGRLRAVGTVARHRPPAHAALSLSLTLAPRSDRQVRRNASDLARSRLLPK